MASHVTKLLVSLEAERKALNKVPGNQLHSVTARDRLRSLAESYFSEVRPFLADSAENPHVAEVDSAMQGLLELCHRKGSIQKYKDLLSQAKKHLVRLDSRLVAGPTRPAGGGRTDVDDRIVTTLRVLLPSAALSYEQALLDLGQDQRLSWRGPATDLREALRETLDRLAPDDEVTGAPGYKQEKDTSGPTMKQKVRYILKSREVSRAIASPTEDATNAVDESIGAFVRSVYTRSSVSTHTPTNKDEVLRVRDLVRVVLAELLEVRQ